MEAEAEHQMYKNGREGERRDDRGLAVPEARRQIHDEASRVANIVDVRTKVKPKARAVRGFTAAGCRISGSQCSIDGILVDLGLALDLLNGSPSEEGR
jgi:hypothetical protein